MAESTKERELFIPDELQEKTYYVNLINSQKIDKEKIYTITARINNLLHSEFGVKNLTHRMIFTACALVAERYGANLRGMKGRDFQTFQTTIQNQLNKAFENDSNQNNKVNVLLEVYSDIRMNMVENQQAIDDFIDCVCEISECINSNEWRGEDVMGIFFNEFNRYKKKSDMGQVFTPEHISSFSYRLIGITPNDYVGDFCCGSGTFLVKSMSLMMQEAGGYDSNKSKEIRQKHLFGIEFDREIYALACANMLIHKDGRANIVQMDTRTDAACEWIRSKPITKVLLNPPYENKFGCLKIVENILDNVKPGTEAAIIMPDKKLEKASKAQIKRILSHHRLTTIIKLPEPLFFGVGVTTSIFVFQAGVPQNSQEIFGCYMEDDGFETVKNKGRHDVKGKWSEIEEYWLDVVRKKRDEKHHTDQWINPDEHLSYQIPEQPFELFEEDFRKSCMDYLLFEEGIDSKKFEGKLLEAVLYSSEVSKGDLGVNILLGDKQFCKKYNI